MNKELEAFVRLEHSSKRYKGRKEDLDIVFTALKDYEKLEKPKTIFIDNGRRMGKTQKLLDDLAKRQPIIWYVDTEKKLKALEVVKECVGLKMSVDEDIGCLYVPITKCFQPLEQNIVVVGYVKGKDKIDLLNEVLL